MRRIFYIFFSLLLVTAVILMSGCKDDAVDKYLSEASENEQTVESDGVNEALTDNNGEPATENGIEGGITSTPENSGDTQEAPNGTPYVYIKADKTEVAPGDVLTFGVYLDCRFFACGDFSIKFPDVFEVIQGKDVSDGELYADGVVRGDEFVFSAYVAQTVNCEDKCFYEIKCNVADTAVSGEAFTVALDVSTFLVGADASGDATVDMLDVVKLGEANVKIK